MSYEGYTEQLCASGHYSAQDCYAPEPTACPHCGAPIAHTHGVDQTNGYSRRYSYSCEAKKVEIGFDDVWHEDHYGTRYATKLIRYEPRGKAWRKVSPSPPPYRGDEMMAENSKIEWTDHTFNPWLGCTKVSPACDHCYAEALMDSRYGRAKWGAGQPRVRTAATTWAQPRKWNRQAEASGARPFVFCASLADVFDNEVDPQWRADLFALIAETPALVWLLLTKRVGNVLKMMADIPMPRNVVIGATMADQMEYDRDRMKLAAVKLALNPLFTFGSFEPMLGPIILDRNAPDWIIVGGESGSEARPMELDWARSLQRQSADLGRVFNFKQVGGRGSDKGGHTLDGRQFFDRPRLAA